MAKQKGGRVVTDRRMTVIQGDMFGEDDVRPAISTTFAQVKFVLETDKRCRGNVGRTVAEVWQEFYGFDHMIRRGDVEEILDVIAGEHKSVPNYKTVSRNYHRVLKKHPDLAPQDE